MLKTMVFAPGPLASAFRIACRNEPGPLSAVLVTVKFTTRVVLAWLVWKLELPV